MRDSEESPTYEPICFQRERCGIKWGYLFMIRKFGFKWMENKYRCYRARLYDAEFERTMPIYKKRLSAEKRICDLQNKREDIAHEGYSLYCKLYGRDGAHSSFKNGEDEAFPVIIHYRQTQIILRFNTLNHIINHLQSYIDKEEVTEQETEELINEEQKLQEKFQEGEIGKDLLNIKFKFHGHCPQNNCPGLITGAMRCENCDTEICGTCKAIKFPSHRCKKADILTTQLIEGDSKPCPKCKVMVFKSEGCNDMFCTHCQTSFNWHTLMINRGFIPHNPYLAEMRARLALPQDENRTPECLDLFDWWRLKKALCGVGMTKGETLEKPQTAQGCMLKVLYHIVRESDMLTRNYNDNRVSDHIFRFKLAKQWLRQEINKRVRRDILWKHKINDDYFDELNMIRRAWVESTLAIISNFVFNSKKIYSGKTSYDDISKQFQQQIRMISKFARDALFILGENSSESGQKLIPPIFFVDIDRFRVLKKDKYLRRVLNDYFIIEKPSKEFMERKNLDKFS
uniref:E3 ubiquitin-protein ligase n=1 Tax=Marseillevirus LCMAC101 TaxID=2506602 RepID=A0A481YS56_9VIRU|nr:MAG: E3 ubiquitin-protein ligase [Marseillevirus LCMAC101]